MDPLFTTNELVTFLSIAVILGLLAGTVAYSWRVAAAAMATGGESRFGNVVRSLGIDVARFSDERALRAAAVSVRRCLNCRHQDACDAWLADPGHKGVPPDCPNEAFLRELSRS
jgi:Family of unknown function (DUF6455)